MKLKFDVEGKSQADPFIFADGENYYLYVTGKKGVEMYKTDDVFGVWKYKGIVCSIDGGYDYWAPSVIKTEGKYYMYFSFVGKAGFERLHVASSSCPEGPFEDPKQLYNEFSIDSHMVKTKSGLFLFYAKNNVSSDLKGTRVFIDKFLDPFTPENDPKEIIIPSFAEERYAPNCKPGNDWYTIEGPFWFCDGEGQYIMYSGGCYLDDTYHIGYSYAKTDKTDLKTVDFIKHTDKGKFAPVITKNALEEGTGHNSVVYLDGKYYAVYHARDYNRDGTRNPDNPRTARICELNVKNGIIKTII